MGLPRHFPGGDRSEGSLLHAPLSRPGTRFFGTSSKLLHKSPEVNKMESTETFEIRFVMLASGVTAQQQSGGSSMRLVAIDGFEMCSIAWPVGSRSGVMQACRAAVDTLHSCDL